MWSHYKIMFLNIWRDRAGRQGVLVGVAGMLALLVAATTGYISGRQQNYRPLPLELSQASSAAIGSNMAVATGPVSDEAEGVFFLDFLTGDLQCLVYYPRSGAFGARYYTNVQSQIPSGGKNAQYLMVTGGAVSSRTSSNLKPANCLVYVTDVSSGMFAAYTVPWNKSAESSSQAQGGPLVFVGGGPIRNYQVADPARNPAPAKVKGVGQADNDANDPMPDPDAKAHANKPDNRLNNKRPARNAKP